jgi:hypothetical protein
MSSAGGQDPPQVPHWMHISSRETPAVRALTSSKKRTLGFGSFEGIVCVVKGHLLYLPDDRCGAKLTREEKPKGFTAWVGWVASDELCFVVGFMRLLLRTV